MQSISRKLFIFLFFLISLFGCQPDPRLIEAEKLLNNNYDSAFQILKKIDSREMNSGSEKALYNLLYSRALFKMEIYTATDSMINYATKYYDEKEPERAAYSWLIKSNIAVLNSEREIQAESLLKAKYFAGIANDSLLTARIYAEQAKIFSEQSKNDSAIHYNKLSLEIYQNSNDKYNYSLNYISLAYYLLLNKQTEKALEHCLKIPDELLRDTIMLSFYKRTLASIYLEMKKYSKALDIYLTTPVTFNEKFDDNTKYLIALCYSKNLQFDSAEIYLNSISYYGEMSYPIYHIREKIFESRGQYREALKYAEKESLARDSIYNNKLSESYAGLEKKYNYQKLHAANQNLKLENFKSGLIILICLLIIASFLAFFFFWRDRNKRKQLKTEHNLLINQSKLSAQEQKNLMLLEKQLGLQKIIFTNLEQYRNNALKKPETIREGFSPLNNDHFYTEIFAAIDLEYNDLSKRLSVKFPVLNETDIFVCCLILAGFDTGMIASILGIKNESMNTRRSRLRTKLQLQSQENLLEFLKNFR